MLEGCGRRYILTHYLDEDRLIGKGEGATKTAATNAAAKEALRTMNPELHDQLASVEQ